MKYEILQHTGDAKIRVWGVSLQELFANALAGMNGILIANRKAQITNRFMRVQSADINALLVDFLNEVNYLRLTNMEVYDKIKFTKFTDTELEGELAGYEVEEFGEDIKAVTFHELDVKKNKEGLWETVIVFDL